MTRTQAWRKVAEMFDKPDNERTPEEWDLTSDGLCYALYRTHGAPEYPVDRMLLDQIRGAVAELAGQQGLLWPGRMELSWTCDCDAERALFAGLMAAMSQRERNQLVEGL